MPVASSSQQFESTCPGNSGTKVCIAMAIEVSRMKKADISGGRCPPESGRVSLESALRGESNEIGL